MQETKLIVIVIKPLKMSEWQRLQQSIPILSKILKRCGGSLKGKWNLKGITKRMPKPKSRIWSTIWEIKKKKKIIRGSKGEIRRWDKEFKCNYWQLESPVRYVKPEIRKGKRKVSRKIQTYPRYPYEGTQIYYQLKW